MDIDKSWTKIRNRTRSIEFKKGLEDIINRARQYVNDRGLIRCPCNDCLNVASHDLETIEYHIYRYGFFESYDTWIYHGETDTLHDHVHGRHQGGYANQRMDEMEAVMEDIAWNEQDDAGSDVQYDELFEALHSELFPGVSSFSSLNFLVKLMHLKVVNKWTNKSIDDLLQLLKLAFPQMNLVDSHYEAKKMMTKLGLGYQPIHVCKYDCALFWKEHANKQNCPVCGESRWEQKTGRGSRKNIPHKVLRYFPLVPRLKRLFAMKDTAMLMRWHSRGKSIDDDEMQHPVDGKAWRDFDEKHPLFASEIRNVRLGLAADGFNPFGNMSSVHSTWPIVMTCYNLPPWLCMRPEYLMLTLLIPGPKAPGKDMDVFLRPLVDELKKLWSPGIDMRDAATSNRGLFRMRAALMWTINDFPARSSLSGWSGQGYLACPPCGEDTPSVRVEGKTAYVGHRRFLPMNHYFRRSLDFDGQLGRRPPPRRRTNMEILSQLNHLRCKVPGKHPSFGGVKMKRSPTELNWRKKSIFYELPYWSTNELKHNIDVMHVEKNICDSLLGTILDDPHKSKDTVNARRDLMKLGIRRELHLYQSGNKLMKPTTKYTLDRADRRKFCNFIGSVKFSDAFASNLRKCIPPNEGRIIGLKSHDCHVIIQRLLPVGCRAYLENAVSKPIIELCLFFRQLCAKKLKISDMIVAREHLILILCKLERIFPPAFFDIMIHLVMHLPDEAILGGPVYMRWIYPIERYLKKLKEYVRNKAKPEGSIAEGYVVDEAMTFCSRYFDDVETRFNRPDRNESISPPTRQFSVFMSPCRPIGAQQPVILRGDGRNQAMFYILNNSPEIESYVNEHREELLCGGYPHMEELHKKTFHSWFYRKVYMMREDNDPKVTDELFHLASGFQHIVQSYTSCIVNGVRFVTYNRDLRRRTQNSGVSVTGIGGEVFYGVLEEILELQFSSDFSVVVFRCKWFKCDDRRMVRENNVTSVNINAEAYKNDQFILATQAKQVFYIDDPFRGPNWRVVQEVHHMVAARDSPGLEVTEIDLLHPNNSSTFSLIVDLGNLEHISLERDDIDAEEVQGSVTSSLSTANAPFIDDDDLEDDTIIEYDDEDVELDSERNDDDDDEDDTDNSVDLD